MQGMETSIKDFSQILQKKVWTLNNDHLRLALLRARLQDLKSWKDQTAKTESNASTLKQINRNISRSYTELIRRISILWTVFTFTLMGVSFGISISRNRSNRSIFSYIVGFGSHGHCRFFRNKRLWIITFSTATLLYIVPHIIIVVFSILMLSRFSRGIREHD